MENRKLPETIKRRCCSGKDCTTTLYLVDNGSPAGWPLLYDYVRGNGTSFTNDWLTEEAMWDWLAQTKEEDIEDH